jgi:hypothetical protein
MENFHFLQKNSIHYTNSRYIILKYISIEIIFITVRTNPTEFPSVGFFVYLSFLTYFRISFGCISCMCIRNIILKLIMYS